MAETTGEKIVLGRIDAPYGIKGWVRIFSYTDPIESILSYSPWCVVKGGSEQTLDVEDARKQGRGLVARLAGYDDRTGAELLTGAEIRIEKRRLPALEAGEYYWHQLEGLTVVNARNEQLGVVDHLLETGGNDVLVVKPAPGSIDERERLVPFVEGRTVKQVDLEARRILVDWEADF